MSSHERIAERDNAHKTPLEYMMEFPDAMGHFCRVCEFGANKYSRDNWKLGGKPKYEYIGAALRHIMQYMMGEDLDKGSNLPHLSHAAWNLFALVQLLAWGKVKQE